MRFKRAHPQTSGYIWTLISNWAMWAVISDQWLRSTPSPRHITSQIWITAEPSKMWRPESEDLHDLSLYIWRKDAFLGLMSIAFFTFN